VAALAAAAYGRLALRRQERGASSDATSVGMPLLAGSAE
jgi:hypothetical protein